MDIWLGVRQTPRSVKRTINNEFKKHLSKEILFGILKDGGKVYIDINEDGFDYHYKASDITAYTEDKNLNYDFKTSQEAMMYAKNNPGIAITRSESGVGYVIK